MNAAKSKLTEIFDGYATLEIPFFQRAYVWEEEQWARLLDDVVDFCSSQTPYFLGAIILKQKRTTSTAKRREVRVVIDGQQRLTALSLLGKALYLKKKEELEGLKEEDIEKLSAEEKAELEEDKITIEQFNNSFKSRGGYIALQHNDTDRAIYEQIMKLEEYEVINSDSKIAETFKYFYDNLNIEIVDSVSICELLQFVNIDIEENEDEQQIFDAINSLGVRLTAAELLKNYFFRNKEGDRKSYEKYWKSVFERDAYTQKYWDTEFVSTRKRESMIDPFFFSYLQIRVQGKDSGVSPKDKDKFSKAGRLFESYKYYIDTYLNEDSLPILEELKEYAEVFRNAIDKGMLYSPIPQRGIARINAVIFRLSMTTLIPYILFVEKNVADVEERNKIYDCIEAFIVCRLLTGKESRGYNTLFGTTLIAKGILSSEELKNFLSTEAVGGNAIPTYAEIQQAFHERTNIKNHTATAILYLIESKLRSQDKNLEERSGNEFHLRPIGAFTLEHIMPVNWEAHWPATDNPDRRNKKLRTMGNFAIVTKGHNSEASNKSWSDKKDMMDDYVKRFKTLYDALNKEQWDEQAIDERAEKLAETLADMYGIDRSSTPEKA